MSHEPLRDVKESTLIRTLSDLASDFADLLQKELRLARAEITQNLSSKFQAGIWMTAAAVIGLLAVVILLEAIIFGLIELGLSPFWAALLVAVVLAGIGAASFFKGRSDAGQDLMPRRTIHQVKEDVRTTKEQLT
jgi:uncharacterized membrane protein YqjE